MTPQIDLSGWPNESQVADILGISERTLRREVAAGKWQPRSRKRPGKKPETVFDPDQVRARMPPDRTSLVESAPMDMDSMAGLTESAVAMLPMLFDLIDQRAAALQPKPEAIWIPLKRASEITGLSVRYLARLIQGKKLIGIHDVFVKVRRDCLEELDPTSPAPARKEKRKRR